MRQRGREFHGIAEKCIWRADSIVEPPPLRLFALHRPAKKEQFARSALTDDARKDRACAHIRARKSDAHEEERDLATRRAEAKIARHREDRARPGAHAIHRGDDRLWTGAHRLHEVARHLRECVKPSVVTFVLHAHERANDVVDIAAAAEVLASAREHHRANVAYALEREEGVGELAIRFERQWILALGTVQRDHGDAILYPPREMFVVR